MKQKTLREDAHSREAETCCKRPRETPECAKAHSFRSIGKGRIKNRKRGNPDMERNTFTYEAIDSALVIHLPKEVDHHNCLTLKYETDLLLAENYINRIIFDFSGTEFMDSSLTSWMEFRASRKLM